MIEHPDQEVRKALIRLCDALCTWERATGLESVLILREQGGFQFRAQMASHSIICKMMFLDSMLFYLIGYREIDV